MVNFDGWSQRWNAWHRINKIMPFRTKAKGYTGQKKVAIRNHYDLKLEDLERVSISSFRFTRVPLPVALSKGLPDDLDRPQWFLGLRHDIVLEW